MEKKSIEEMAADIKVIRELASSGTMLQDTMQKIVNDSKGGMVCIII